MRKIQLVLHNDPGGNRRMAKKQSYGNESIKS